MYQQIQLFHFDGPAEEVYAFLLRDGASRQYVDGDFTFFTILASEPDFHSVITVVMSVGLLWNYGEGVGANGAAPERVPHPCAKLQLRLAQTRPGACVGRLYIRMIALEAAAASQGLTVEEAEAAIRRFVAENWRQLIACWERFKRACTASPPRTPARGGRPRNGDDDWAYEQVVMHGRPRPVVYREWLQRIGDRAKELADPQDSFRRAIQARGK